MSCGPAGGALFALRTGVGGISGSGSAELGVSNLGLESDAGVNVGDGEGAAPARLVLGSPDLIFKPLSSSGLGGKPMEGLLLLFLEGGRDLDMVDATCDTYKVRTKPRWMNTP
jgi:hypothetical protein